MARVTGVSSVVNTARLKQIFQHTTLRPTDKPLVRTSKSFIDLIISSSNLFGYKTTIISGENLFIENFLNFD